MSSKCNLKAQSALDAKFNAVRMSRSLRNKGPKDGTEQHAQYKAYSCEVCGAWHVTEKPVIQSKPRHRTEDEGVLIPVT